MNYLNAMQKLIINPEMIMVHPSLEPGTYIYYNPDALKEQHPWEWGTLFFLHTPFDFDEPVYDFIEKENWEVG